jgi:hypothetical protein
VAVSEESESLCLKQEARKPGIPTLKVFRLHGFLLKPELLPHAKAAKDAKFQGRQFPFAPVATLA